jgi:hypothetical protein
MIGEIAARLSGGYMSGWTYPYSSGAAVTRAAIFAALGKEMPGLKADRSWTSAERAFISIPGRVRSIEGLEEARSGAYIKDLFLRAEPGGRVCFPENNVSKCGNIISAAPTREAAVAAAEHSARSVLIRLEAPDDETGAFLSAPAADFPPDAYRIPQEMRALLLRLPEPEQDHAGSTEKAALALIPFPEFIESGLRDYTGRTVAESLEAVRKITGLPLPIAGGADTGQPARLIGRGFWAALIRGGYQGAAYMADTLIKGRS